jgi:hypothetical protein
VTISEGVHPFPSRTRQLSPPEPMVLGAQAPGRVGRRQNNFIASWSNQEACLFPTSDRIAFWVDGTWSIAPWESMVVSRFNFKPCGLITVGLITF